MAAGRKATRRCLLIRLDIIGDVAAPCRQERADSISGVCAAHPGAEQPIVRYPEPSADFPAHVHLYQRKLLKISRVHLVKVSS